VTDLCANLKTYMGRKLLKTVHTLFGILSLTPWEPVADPLWSADPSLKTADLIDRHFDTVPACVGQTPDGST